MNYENMLLILVAAAAILQFYFTFLKGKSNVKSPGIEVYRLRSNGLKLKLLGLLFILILFYLFYALINSLLSYLGLAVVFYALLCVLDFSKVNIITEKGIGTKNFYDKQLYNFVLWEDITEFEWSDRRATMLIYKYTKGDKNITTDWEVCQKDKPEVEKLFKQHVKMKSNKSQKN